VSLLDDPEMLIEAVSAMPEDLPLLMQNLERSPWIRAVLLQEAVEDLVGSTPVQKVTLRVLAKRDTSETSPLNARVGGATGQKPKSPSASARMMEETK
jgi:hypothetical protein